MLEFKDTLTINGRKTCFAAPECKLFAGRLDIGLELQNDEYSEWCNLPYSDVFEFSQLSGRKVLITDCAAENFENPLLNPWFTIDASFYSITSLRVVCGEYSPSRQTIAIEINSTGSNDEDGTAVSVNGHFTAACIGATSNDVLNCLGGFPVRFANYYLPLLGLPQISEHPDRALIISLFGQPDDEGGGNHPQFGFIEPWMRFMFPTFHLHFRMDSDNITHITVMPRTGSFSL